MKNETILLFTREDDIIYAENEFVKMAMVVTADVALIGTSGWHGPREIWVKYISPKQADALWISLC